MNYLDFSKYSIEECLNQKRLYFEQYSNLHNYLESKMIFTTDNYDIAFEAMISFHEKFYDEELKGTCMLSFSSEYEGWQVVVIIDRVMDTIKFNTLADSFKILWAQIVDEYEEDEDE